MPLDRLAVPSELDGRAGVFRTGRPNTFGVDTDLAALFAWLRRHQDSPRTAVSYGRIVERFYLGSGEQRNRQLTIASFAQARHTSV